MTTVPGPAPAAAAGDPAAAAAVRVTGVAKRYGDVVALAGVDLVVGAGEFFTLLGPSGSGKTTLLRLIAGFERPDGGRIELGGRDVTGVPPYSRNVNTVFQDYALFPHLTVAQNIEYGLRVRRVAKPERREKVDRALEMVRLPGLGARKPAQLSGGQRQRVALWIFGAIRLGQQLPEVNAVVSIVILLTIVPVVLAARLAGAGAVTRSARAAAAADTALPT